MFKVPASGLTRVIPIISLAGEYLDLHALKTDSGELVELGTVGFQKLVIDHEAESKLSLDSEIEVMAQVDLSQLIERSLMLKLTPKDDPRKPRLPGFGEVQRKKIIREDDDI